MKKCSWCGKEYPDTAQQCAIDAQPLVGGEEQAAVPSVIEIVSSTPAAAPEPVAAPVNSGQTAALTDRQLRIFEIVLLSLVAFGGSILLSTRHFFAPRTGVSSG